MSSQYYRPLGLTSALLLVLLQSAQALPVLAATPTGHLIIGEINWANASEQWVELSNPTDQPIDFSLTPYTLTTSGGSVTLSTGKVDPNGTIILSKLDPTDPKSSLGAGLNVVVKPTLSLPVGAGAYALLEGTTQVDSANSSTAAPFAGHGSSATDASVASEQRVNFSTNGSQSTSWRTSIVTGRFIKQGSSLLATPGQINGAVVQPLTSSTLNVGTDPLRPTVSVVGPTGIQADVRFMDVATSESIKGNGNSTSGFMPETPLVAGHRYSVIARSVANESFSAPLTVTLPGSSNALYAPAAVPAVMNTGTPSVPVLAASVPVTNKLSVELSGTTVAGTQLVAAVNGAYQASQMLNADQTAFRFFITLTQNTVNRIEVRSKAVDGTVSAPAIAMVTQNSRAMAAVDVNKLNVSIDGLSGMPHAASPLALVTVFADSALTQKLAEAMAAPDGSFASIALGRMLATTLYVVETDSAGNISPSVHIANPIIIAGQDLSIPIAFSAITTNSVSLRLQSVSGAMGYLLKYKTVDGQYTAPTMVCSDMTTSCDLRKSIIALQPGTAYIFAVAAVDGQGQASKYTEAAFQTLQALPPNIGGSTTPLTPLPTIATTSVVAPAPVVVAVAPAVPVTPVAPSRVSMGVQSTPTPAVAATPAPASEMSPTTSPEAGAVESASTQARNWTPWIVLGILVGLALLATAGYFYWFGGEAGAAADVATKPKPTEQLPPAKEIGSVKESTDKDKPKRW